MRYAIRSRRVMLTHTQTLAGRATFFLLGILIGLAAGLWFLSGAHFLP